jgi:hypothetical protein
MTMKLYRVNAVVPYFVGTQAEAKSDARTCKCDWELVEVPTDKEGLIGYLNTHGGNPCSIQLVGDDSEQEVDDNIASETVKPVAPPKAVVDQTSVEDYILNEASTAQVEQLFARIGTRFKEAVIAEELLG